MAVTDGHCHHCCCVRLRCTGSLKKFKIFKLIPAVKTLRHGMLHEFSPSGFIDMDSCQGAIVLGALQIPALHWGFTRETCLCIPQLCAQMTYATTKGQNRVLHMIDNYNNTMGHCLFVDDGCGGTCDIEPAHEPTRKTVGETGR